MGQRDEKINVKLFDIGVFDNCLALDRSKVFRTVMKVRHKYNSMELPLSSDFAAMITWNKKCKS